MVTQGIGLLHPDWLDGLLPITRQELTLFSLGAVLLYLPVKICAHVHPHRFDLLATLTELLEWGARWIARTAFFGAIQPVKVISKSLSVARSQLMARIKHPSEGRNGRRRRYLAYSGSS